MWLVVLGHSTWVAGPGKRYKAGIYEVDDDTAALARSQNLAWLVVSEEKPEIENEVIGVSGPGITLEDLRIGTGRGIRLVDAEDEFVPEPEPEPGAPPLNFPCSWCPRRFPTQGSLKRHIKHHHTIRHERTEEAEQAEAEAAREEKAAQARVEAVDEKKLPPWEREAVDPTPPVQSV